MSDAIKAASLPKDDSGTAKSQRFLPEAADSSDTFGIKQRIFSVCIFLR